MEDDLNGFDWKYKNLFDSCVIVYENYNEGKKSYLFESKDMKNTVLVIKYKINTNNYLRLSKEVYFLACCKNNKYFAEIIDVFITKDQNYLFIIIRAEGTDLKSIIDYENFDYNTAIPNFSRFAIFQIVCGLKILHSNGLSHNGIEPGNIIVSDNGKIKICDMGSTDKISTIKYGGTTSYSSPQCLLGKKRTKEDDMWSVGIVFLELLKKRSGIFNLIIDPEIRRDDRNKLILKYILENFYDINLYENHIENNKYNLIIQKISNDEYNSFEAKFKSNLLADINNEDKELIENLLQIDPSKRKTAEEVLNLKMFNNLNCKFEDSSFYYLEKEYNYYFNNQTVNLNIFNNYIQGMKSKFIGQEIFK